MIYNSLFFLLCFPLIFLLYYLIPARYKKLRNLYLLVVSYILYINWKPFYALVLLSVTVITYVFSRLIEKSYCSKTLVWLGGVLSVFPLLLFKYYDFINQQFFGLLSFVGLRYEFQGLNWAIPIGISFYTFQALGYLFDVYYKRIEAEKDFLIYALFISFFPSIVAGPINKGSLVLPQLKKLRPYFDYNIVVEGLRMILWGMFMKVVIADRLGLYVDVVLPNYMNYSGMTCLIASFFYTIQIYSDFAGYSLMAIGVAKMLGFELTENFCRPYFSVSITDFWRRWHISLSTWLRDYVYIPMGGSRCSKWRNYLNIILTFLVSGIWHGANWTFIVWGIWHGTAQILEKNMGQQNCNYGGIGKAIKIGITFLLVNFAWIFFRMPTLLDAWGCIKQIFDFTLPFSVFMPKGGKTDVLIYIVSITMLFAKDYFEEFYPNKIRLFENENIIIRWASYSIILVLILTIGVLGADQFIYANF